MAQIIFDIPDGLVPDMVAAFNRIYGENVNGMTTRQKIIYHLQSTLKPHIRAHRVSVDATLTIVRGTQERNNLAREARAKDDTVAVENAEASLARTLEADLEGIT